MTAQRKSTIQKPVNPEIYTSIREAIEAVSDVPVYRQIETLMEEAIESGALPPGGKLPPERLLMDLVGVSRSTLRSALSGLIERGYLNATQGRGNFVQGPRRKKDLRFLALEKFRADHWQISPVHYDWLSAAAKASGVQLHYHYTPTNEELFRILSNPPPGYDGLILFRTLPEWSEALCALTDGELQRFPKPIVIIGRPLNRPPLNAISYDYFEATRQATHLLLAEGHQEVGLVSGYPAPGHSFQEFLEGYTAALSEAGVPFDTNRTLLLEGNILQGGATPDLLIRRMEDFLHTRRFTAAVVGLITAPFERAVQRQGIIVPDDLSVVTVTEEHVFATCALRWTGMSEPSAMIVERGVEMLAEVCRGERQRGTYEVIAPIHQPGGTVTQFYPKS